MMCFKEAVFQECRVGVDWIWKKAGFIHRNCITLKNINISLDHYTDYKQFFLIKKDKCSPSGVRNFCIIHIFLSFLPVTILGFKYSGYNHL